MKTLFFSPIPAEAKWLKPLVQEQSEELDMLPLSLGPDTVQLSKGYYRVIALTQAHLADSVWKSLVSMGVKEMILGGPVHLDAQAPAEVSPGGIVIRRVPISTPQTEAQWSIFQLMKLLKLPKSGSQLLHGRRVGLLGFGRTGKVLGQILHGFGCRVLAWDRNPDRNFAFRYGIEFADLDILMSRCDIISLQLPLEADTKGLLSAANWGQACMPQMLVNVSHPEILNLDDLAMALEEGKISGFAQSDASAFNLPSAIMTKLWELAQFPQVIVDPRASLRTEDAIRNRIRLAFRMLEQSVYA